MKMKTGLALLAGMVLVFTFGIANSNEGMSGAKEEGGTTISDEGGMPTDVEQNRATEGTSSEYEKGSAAGGVTKEPGIWKSDNDQRKRSDEKTPAGSDDKGAGTGEAWPDTHESGY